MAMELPFGKINEGGLPAVSKGDKTVLLFLLFKDFWSDNVIHLSPIFLHFGECKSLIWRCVE